MIQACLLILMITAGGVAISYAFDEERPFVFRLAAGSVIGLTIFGFAGTLIGALFGLSAASTLASGAVAALPTFLFRDTRYRGKFSTDFAEFRRVVARYFFEINFLRSVALLAYAGLFILLGFFFRRAMLVMPDGGIGTGAANNLGDLPYHLLIVNGFAAGQSFPPDNPIYSGATMSYPFIADLIAALFTLVGTEVQHAFFIENFVLVIATVVLLAGLTLRLTGSGFAAALSPFLFVFGGGFGFLLFFGDAMSTDAGILKQLFQLKSDYTLGVGPIWRWGNPMTTLFVTQRTLLLGLPLALIIFTALLRLIETPSKGNGPSSKFPDFRTAEGRQFLIVGLCAGLLPLVHSHTFLVVAFVSTIFALMSWKNGADWCAYFIGLAAAAIPQLIFIRSGSASVVSQFIGLDLGWDNGDHNPLWFWFVNTGILIPVLLTGVWLLLVEITKERSASSPSDSSQHRDARRMLMFFMPFVLIFAGANAFRLAPWIWDNIKVLVYCHVAAVPIIAWVIAQARDRFSGSVVLTPTLVVLLTLSGWLDVWRLATAQIEHQILSPALVQVAREINGRIPRDSLIVTAPEYATLPVLTGSRWFLGYTGHVWSHGISSHERDAVVRKIYGGGDEAKRLLRENEIDYVVVGPQERQFTKVDEQFFEMFRVVAESGDYRVFEITSNHDQ